MERDLYLIKGFLLAHNAPPEIMAALEALTGSNDTAVPTPVFTVPLAATAPARRTRLREPRIAGDQADRIRQMVKDGLSDLEIGKQYGYGNQTVADYRRLHGILRPKGNPKWRRNDAGITANCETTTYTDENGRTITKSF